MKGEFISIETAQIMADMEKENKELQQRIDKAIYKIKFEWEKILKIPRYDLHLHTVDGLVIKRILNILEGKDE